jgi:hypothetical protein
LIYNDKIISLNESSDFVIPAPRGCVIAAKPVFFCKNRLSRPGRSCYHAGGFGSHTGIESTQKPQEENEEMKKLLAILIASMFAAGAYAADDKDAKKDAKADAKMDKKEAKADAKMDKKEAKADAKMDKKEAKADAKMDKKEAKADAKMDKKEAKADAKMDKKDDKK